MRYTAAIIGTGADPDETNRTGYAMAYRHAPGYKRHDDVELVACADLVRENAVAFADHFGIDRANVYEDYELLLEEVDVDVVSVCTPPATHTDIVVGAAASGAPAAIHCEKPMATTPGDCREMVSVCEREGVQLTIDHQRRFSEPFRRAKDIFEEGTIGDLKRVECGEVNFFDAGVHQFDLCGYYTDDAAPKWVLANVDYCRENRWFGTRNETHGVAHWQYDSGVDGVAFTGEDDGFGIDVVGCYLRLLGTDGVIELGVEDGPSLRYRVDGADWQSVDTGDSIHAPSPSIARAGAKKLLQHAPVVDESALSRPTFYERAIAEAIDALAEDRRPEICGTRSLRATELAFGVWESARRRGRVTFPLEIDDNPLDAMVETGVFEGGPDGNTGRRQPSPDSDT